MVSAIASHTIAAPNSGTAIHWNHLKTVLLILGTNSVYFCQMLFIVGAETFPRSIAAVVGRASLAPWCATVLLIITAVLAPPVSQAADYWGRKWFLVVSAVFGCVGCIIISRASSMGMALVGFTVGGLTFAAQPLLHAVASEVLPRKYRSFAQTSISATVTAGIIFSLLMGGYLTRDTPAGFRTYWYITAGICAFAAIASGILYNPPAREAQVVLSTRGKIHSMDWIGILLLGSGLALFCLALSWAQNPYSWTDAHVLAPLLIGAVLLMVLVVYEWQFTRTGLFHHDLFRSRNLPIAICAILIEGLAFMTANAFVPYELNVLYGGTMSPFRIALCYSTAFYSFLFFSCLAGIYMWRTKTVRLLCVLSFLSFTAFFISMATIKATTSSTHVWGYVLLYGMGLGICLTTLVTAAQLSTPPELIAITSGLILSMRSVGGAIGYAIQNAILSRELSDDLVAKVASHTSSLSFSRSNVAALIEALTAGNLAAAEGLPGATSQVIAAAGLAIKQVYAVGFRNVFICAGAFSFLGACACVFLVDPRAEFNETIDAPLDIINGKEMDVEDEQVESNGKGIPQTEVNSIY